MDFSLSKATTPRNDNGKQDENTLFGVQGRNSDAEIRLIEREGTRNAQRNYLAILILIRLLGIFLVGEAIYALLRIVGSPYRTSLTMSALSNSF
jgi:hypothetical protein